MTNIQIDVHQQAGTTPLFATMPPDSNGALPEHLKAPAGVDQQVYEINLTIAVLLLEAAAARRWLDRTHPDSQAACRTSARILQHAMHLDELINNL